MGENRALRREGDQDRRALVKPNRTIHVIEDMAMNAITQPIEIALDEIGLPEGHIMADSIRQWRSDCQSGQFKIGAATMRGGKLNLEIVGAQINQGEFYGYPLQVWLAVLFVDPEGVLSSILFKTQSLDNFEELRRQYRLKGETLLGKTLRATMSKRASKSGNGYFAVEFEVVSEGKYAVAIADFRQQHYSPALFRLLSGPTENGHGVAPESSAAAGTERSGKKR